MFLYWIFACMIAFALLAVFLPWSARTLLVPVAKTASFAGREGKSENWERSGMQKWAPLAATFCSFLAAVSMYGWVGRPDLPSVSYSSQDQFDLLIAHVEAHLALHPKDARGWDVIAPIYLRRGRYRDAVRAYANSLQLSGANLEHLIGLGESLVYANSGVVTEDAVLAFSEALKKDPKRLVPRFYLALAKEQSGDLSGARSAFSQLYRDFPEQRGVLHSLFDTHVQFVSKGEILPAQSSSSGEEEESQVRRKPRQLSDLPSAALAKETTEKSILLMVKRLSDRLEQEGGSPEEWAHLLRSFVVLGREKEASAAFQKAEKEFSSDAQAMVLLRQAYDFGRETESRTSKDLQRSVETGEE